MGKLSGKIAIVTGASSGVGAGIAKVLAAHGASVVLCARRQEKLDEIRRRSPQFVPRRFRFEYNDR